VQSWGSRWNPDGSLRQIKPRGTVADDSSYDLLGVYLQDEITIGDRLTIIPGARWTWAQADTGKLDPDLTDNVALEGSTEDYDAFTFSLRARYDVTKNWNFFTGLSQGFRAPNLSDLTAFDIARSGEREVPSPGLDPEQYLAFEFGTKVSLEKLDFYAAYYKTWIDDQLVRFPTGNVIAGEPEVRRANSGDGYIQGVEAGLTWRFAPGWEAFGNIAWSEGEVGQFDGTSIGVYPASRIHPLMGQVGLRWESGDRKWWAEGSVILARHQDRLSLGDQGDTQRIPPGGTRGYHVYSVRAGWRPTAFWDVYAACENISNEDYRIHGSGVNEAGTNFVFGTKLAF
jgi:hemoglobin/transferrin/lactoferrin receptor protein